MWISASTKVDAMVYTAWEIKPLISSVNIDIILLKGVRTEPTWRFDLHNLHKITNYYPQNTCTWMYVTDHHTYHTFTQCVYMCVCMCMHIRTCTQIRMYVGAQWRPPRDQSWIRLTSQHPPTQGNGAGCPPGRMDNLSHSSQQKPQMPTKDM